MTVQPKVKLFEVTSKASQLNVADQSINLLFLRFRPLRRNVCSASSLSDFSASLELVDCDFFSCDLYESRTFDRLSAWTIGCLADDGGHDNEHYPMSLAEKQVHAEPSETEHRDELSV